MTSTFPFSPGNLISPGNTGPVSGSALRQKPVKGLNNGPMAGTATSPLAKEVDSALIAPYISARTAKKRINFINKQGRTVIGQVLL